MLESGNDETNMINNSPDKGLLTDDVGKRSTMRLMCIIALLASIWFAYLTIVDSTGSKNGVYITSAFLLAAIAPKAL